MYFGFNIDVEIDLKLANASDIASSLNRYSYKL